jgi:hypothetical protein
MQGQMSRGIASFDWSFHKIGWPFVGNGRYCQRGKGRQKCALIENEY